MNKEETIAALNRLELDLRALRTAASRVKSAQVKGKEISESDQRTSRKWFEDIEPAVSRSGIPADILAKYSGMFNQLLGLSFKNPAPSTYVKIIDGHLEDFKQDLVATVMKSSGPIVGFSQLDKVLETIVNEAEKDYLTEAVSCAQRGYLRASTVMGWNAAVHRMHRVVEKMGFEEFNKKSEEMKKITEGRYKRFNKSFSIHTISELRSTVFDTDLLWVLEYWGLIDGNQHERLQACFTMRSNCAHPGEAAMSPENLASFYSDLKNMVFDNPKFNV